MFDFRAVFLTPPRSVRYRFQQSRLMIHPWIRSAKWILMAFVFAASVHVNAAEEEDTEGLTPVPADQQIPVSDFFRYGRIQVPRLNDSGTHVAATISDGQDK